MFYKFHSNTRLINHIKVKQTKTFHHNQDLNQSLKIHKYIYGIAFTVTIIILFRTTSAETCCFTNLPLTILIFNKFQVTTITHLSLMSHLGLLGLAYF